MIRFDRYGAVAVEFNFEEPLGAVRQVRDRGALHWLDKLGFSSWERIQPLARNLPHTPSVNSWFAILRSNLMNAARGIDEQQKAADQIRIFTAYPSDPASARRRIKSTSRTTDGVFDETIPRELGVTPSSTTEN